MLEDDGTLFTVLKTLFPNMRGDHSYYINTMIILKIVTSKVEKQKQTETHRKDLSPNKNHF